MIIGNNQSINVATANKRYDICICGTGPAGITLARKLANKGWLVALMEGGGLEFDNQSQQLYRGKNLGEEYPILESRLRFFGGASNHWGGETRPLDPRDFSALPHHSLNEWPILKQDLDIYAQEAGEILDLQESESAEDIFDDKAAHLKPLEPPFRNSIPPTRFGKKYLQEISNSPLIHLYLKSNITNIDLDSAHKSVSRFLFKTDRESTDVAIHAKHFILCCGGLENPRTLLLANQQIPQGIGNKNDLVGRYFCEHIVAPIGKAVMHTGITRPKFNLCSTQLMREKKCLSFMVEFDISKPASGEAFLDRLRHAVFNRSDASKETGLYAITQQACSPENRVTLSNEKDALGLNKLALNWQASKLDNHTLRTAAIELAISLATSDLGRMQVAPFILDKRLDIPISHMNHHMCTTRMGRDAKQGVVDKNCLVFGTDNLFIAGSSVFSSCGVSNPTYTIIQLALRLSDHLHDLLKSAR